MTPTIGQLTATWEPEELLGLTCQGCDRPATTTLELTHGTPEEITGRVVYRVCRQHVLEFSIDMIQLRRCRLDMVGG